MLSTTKNKMKINLLILIPLALASCTFKSSAPKANKTTPKTGVMIIDAQKWYIPGHPESMYNLWNITGHSRSSDAIISSMGSVVDWANSNQIPIFVTYEAKDTGRYNLPNEILSKLDSSKTIRFVKKYFDATKHPEFKNLVINSNIDRWIVIGAETDVCVYQTSKGLLRLGKEVTLITDAIYSGRNDTKISERNLELFGAHFLANIHVYNQQPIPQAKKDQIENPINFEDVILTIFPFSDSSSQEIGLQKRLNNLKKYAEITGMKVERFDSISNRFATRVLAGNVNASNYDSVKKNHPKDIIILADVATNMNSQEFHKNTRLHTVKSFFYEMMETVDFYFIAQETLPGWQRGLRNAIDNELAPYLESNQND